MFTKKRIFLAVVSSFICMSSTAYADTLRQAVQETIKSNPDILITEKTALADNEQVMQSASGYYPKVDLTGDYGRDRAANINTGFNNVTLWRTDDGIVARQPIFDGFDTPNEIARTQAHTDADAYQVLGASEDQALAAAEAYLNVLRTQKIVSLAEENLDIHEQIDGMIRQRSQSGVGAEADTYQSYGRLESAKANLLAAESDERDAESNYLKVVGLNPNNLAPPPVPGALAIPPTEDAAIQEALGHNPILKAAKANVYEATAQERASNTPFFPHVDFELSSQHGHNVDGVPGQNNEQLALVEGNWNIFHGGGDIGHKNETAYLTQKAMEIRDRAYRQTLNKMQLSWSALETAQSRLSPLLEHQNAAAKTVVAYQDQFKLNQRTLLDVLDSDNELFQSRIDYVNGTYDVIDAKYRILNSEGRLLQYLEVSPPPEAMTPYSYGAIS